MSTYSFLSIYDRNFDAFFFVWLNISARFLELYCAKSCVLAKNRLNIYKKKIYTMLMATVMKI